MAFWQSMTTAKMPLTEERDVWARIGFRFVWCTFPYFVVAQGLAGFLPERSFPAFGGIVALAVPITGGLLDWYRIQRKITV